MAKSGVVAQDCLVLNNQLLKDVYQHVTFLANFRYRSAIETLQAKHRGYEIEDFVQETLQEVYQQLKKKTFPTMPHLKSFINKIMQFHYLKEKRKYYYTKQRGSYYETYIDDECTKNQNGDARYLRDTLQYEEKLDLEGLADLQRLYNRNLFIVYDWRTVKICKKHELKDFKEGCITSVNYFINKQIELGRVDCCKYYKSQGFHMTKKVFDDITKELLRYLKEQDYIDVPKDLLEDEHTKFDRLKEKLESAYNMESSKTSAIDLSKLYKRFKEVNYLTPTL